MDLNTCLYIGVIIVNVVGVGFLLRRNKDLKERLDCQSGMISDIKSWTEIINIKKAKEDLEAWHEMNLEKNLAEARKEIDKANAQIKKQYEPTIKNLQNKSLETAKVATSFYDMYMAFSFIAFESAKYISSDDRKKIIDHISDDVAKIKYQSSIEGIPYVYEKPKNELTMALGLELGLKGIEIRGAGFAQGLKPPAFKDDKDT